MASSSIVIKAKYRKTLRRFRATISNKKLALDVVVLRDKIRGFFGFGYGVDFTMNYVDEDGDLVMLASDDDLYDIVLQSLNPLRITVSLDNDGKLGGSSGTTVAPLTSQKNMLPYQTYGASATLQSPQQQSQFRLLNSLVPQTLYSSSQLEPQIQNLKSGVTQTQLLEKMKKAQANPKFTFTASGASNVCGQHGMNFISSTVKESVSKVQVSPEVGSTNSKKKGKLVQKATEDVELNGPSFGLIKPFPTPFNATKSLEDSWSKLDSVCLGDVSALDGTIMAPYTKFTKIWKMWNKGPLSWPQGSQLKWVRGDRLSNSDSVDIKIPADGLPMYADLDIEVELTAPGFPGLYVSFWQMVSFSGQKFGNQVWVMIQVSTFVEDLDETMANVNPPPVLKKPEVGKQDHLMDTGNSFIKVSDSESATIDSQSKDQENHSDVSSNMATPSVFLAFNSTKVETALASLPVGLDTGSKLPPAIQDVRHDRERARLKDLEVMGFKQLDLNKEILRMNNYDLEKSVDDLCGVFRLRSYDE